MTKAMSHNVGAGDRVLTTSYTFFATAAAISSATALQRWVCPMRRLFKGRKLHGRPYVRRSAMRVHSLERPSALQPRQLDYVRTYPGWVRPAWMCSCIVGCVVATTIS